MDIVVDIEAEVLSKFLKRYPQRMDANMKLLVDRVGYKLDAESKRVAPAITGNLRRNIIYNNGQLIANANYSAYVHGRPFYKNKMRRKETPFITRAISSSETFIKNETRLAINRVLR